MSNLYELNDNIRQLQAIYEAGEIPEDAFNDTLEALNMEREEAIENICKWRTNILADIEGYKTEIERLTNRKKAAENLIKRLQNYILSSLSAAGQKKLKAGTFTVSIVKSAPALKIYDESLIPKTYYVPQPDKLDHAAIKEAIKSGQKVPGAELVQGEHLNIR